MYGIALSTFTVVVVSMVQMLCKANYELVLFVSHHRNLIEWFSCQSCLGVCPASAPPGYASNSIYIYILYLINSIRIILSFCYFDMYSAFECLLLLIII